MTTAQVVETLVTVNNNSPIQDYVHPDDQTQPTFEMTPGFKPFPTPNLLHWYWRKMTSYLQGYVIKFQVIKERRWQHHKLIIRQIPVSDNETIDTCQIKGSL